MKRVRNKTSLYNIKLDGKFWGLTAGAILGEAESFVIVKKHNTFIELKHEKTDRKISMDLDFFESNFHGASE